MSDDSSVLKYFSAAPPALAPSLKAGTQPLLDDPQERYFLQIPYPPIFEADTIPVEWCRDLCEISDDADETEFLNHLLQENSKPYRVTGLIGSGGFADVYMGYDVKSHELIAVKLMKKNCSASQGIHLAFLIEPLLIKNLNHPNIVDVYDYLIEPRPLHIMKYVERPTIGSEARPVDDSFVRNFLEDMASLLLYFERVNFMHGDIKPSNIRMTDKLEFKLMDFGGSIYINHFGDTPSRSYTPGFAAPEVLQNMSFNTLQDIYSFGKTLGNILTGKNLATPKILALLSEMYQTDIPLSLREILVSTTQDSYRQRPSAKYLDELVADYKRETSGKQVFRPTHIHTFWQRNKMSPVFGIIGYVPDGGDIIKPIRKDLPSRESTRNLRKNPVCESTSLQL